MLQLANVLSNNKFFKASATHYSGLGIRSLALSLKIAHTVLLSTVSDSLLSLVSKSLRSVMTKERL